MKHIFLNHVPLGTFLYFLEVKREKNITEFWSLEHTCRGAGYWGGWKKPWAFFRTASRSVLHFPFKHNGKEIPKSRPNPTTLIVVKSIGFFEEYMAFIL